MTPSELTKLSHFMRQRFHDDTLEVRGVPGHPAAGLYDGEEFIGILTRDEDEGEVSYDFVMKLEGEEETMSMWELTRLKEVLKEKLNDPKLDVRAREKKTDSAEVYSGEEFIGIIFCGTDDDEREMSFNMGILDIDLDDAAGSA